MRLKEIALDIYSHTNARRSIIDTLAFRALSQLATMLSYVLLVRRMPEQSFGIYSILYSFIPVISTVASLGLVQTLRRFQPEYLSARHPERAAWLFRTVTWIRLVSNVLVLTAILLAWHYLAPLLKVEPYRFEFAVFCVLILLYFQCRILELALAAHMAHRYSVGAVAAMSFIKLGGYGLLYLENGLTLLGAIAVDIAAYAAAYVIMRVAYARAQAGAGTGAPARPERSEVRRLFKYGLYNNLNDSGAMILNARTDNFFIAAIMAPLSVATYAFFTRLNEMVAQLLPIRLFENVIQPLFYATPRAEAAERIPRYFSLLVNTNLLVLWPALVYSLVYHHEIVTFVFAGKFSEYSWLLPLLAAFSLSDVFSTPLTLVAQYDDKSGLILLSKWTALYNIAALLILIPLMGILGATLATGTAHLLKNAFIWWHVRERADWTNATTALTSGCIIWTITGLACYALKSFGPAGTLVSLLIGLCVLAAGWLAYVRSPAISASDRSLLSGLLHGRERKWLHRVGLLGEP